ncbi:hypothetical protein HDU67_007228 [Dinochytrium kinnereticum]|nr:hypothetical protein HDU67_007228 [Dinochytrium kinnereticum]
MPYFYVCDSLGCQDSPDHPGAGLLSEIRNILKSSPGAAAIIITSQDNLNIIRRCLPAALGDRKDVLDLDASFCQDALSPGNISPSALSLTDVRLVLVDRNDLSNPPSPPPPISQDASSMFDEHLEQLPEPWAALASMKDSAFCKDDTTTKENRHSAATLVGGEHFWSLIRRVEFAIAQVMLASDRTFFALYIDPDLALPISQPTLHLLKVESHRVESNGDVIMGARTWEEDRSEDDMVVLRKINMTIKTPQKRVKPGPPLLDSKVPIVSTFCPSKLPSSFKSEVDPLRLDSRSPNDAALKPSRRHLRAAETTKKGDWQTSDSEKSLKAMVVNGVGMVGVVDAKVRVVGSSDVRFAPTCEDQSLPLTLASINNQANIPPTNTTGLRIPAHQLPESSGLPYQGWRPSSSWDRDPTDVRRRMSIRPPLEELVDAGVVGAIPPPSPVRRALICEDNKINQRILERTLNLMGISSKIVENGHDCLRLLYGDALPHPTPLATQSQDMNFDIIFMDIVLPHIDGITTTREIRRLEDLHPSVPHSRFHIVGVSSLGRPDIIRTALEAGMDSFILKPWKREQIHVACGRPLEGFAGGERLRWDRPLEDAARQNSRIRGQVHVAGRVHPSEGNGYGRGGQREFSVPLPAYCRTIEAGLGVAAAAGSASVRSSTSSL